MNQDAQSGTTESVGIQERIRNGAALLDKHEPGWRDRIAPGDLKMQSCTACVLGQLFGEFAKGLDKPWMMYEDPHDFGFYSDSGYGEYPELTAGWMSYIKGEWS